MSAKRSRSDMSGDPRVRRAMAINARINKMFPYKDYGRAYYKRGTDANLNMWGPTYKTASREQQAMRRSFGYVGRGKYRGRGGYWMQKLFGAKPGGFWDTLGDKVADAVPGANLISAGGEMLHKAVTGGGLYKGRGQYAANDTVSGSGSLFQAPTFTPLSDGGTGVTISHREYLGELFAPDLTKLNFENNVYNINPGLEKSFPWLSQVAGNYEEYELVQCIFTFKSTTTDIGSSTNGQCGTIIMATQYDVDDEPFADKETMLRYTLAESAKATDHMIHGVECDPRKLSGAPGKYVRTQPIVTNSDLKNYDHGVLNVACANIPASYANQSLGELWISYTVKLRKPKINSAKAWNIEREVYCTNGTINGGAAISDGILGSTIAGRQVFWRGQQNSIGCYVNPKNGPPPPAPPGSYYSPECLIRFPATYTGNIRVIVHAIIDNAGPAEFYSVVCQPQGPPCNIRPINDIPSNSSTTAIASWSNQRMTRDAANLGGTSIEILAEFHFDVGIPFNGVENQLFAYFEVRPSFAGVNVIMSSLEIEEYNTSFNFKQDGTNDQIRLVDEFGTLQSWT